ncbi:SUKH-4 family immunity protein [Streptomyces parvulus]|uniref:SUKH-4 family immunity protein n=1 Tax=Streptomyces parvulus TaxID=146923 RepID=UPI00380A3B33
MVTFAQAQERAEEWVNGELPAYQHREVRVREFDLGFVVWAEDRADGPRSDGGAQRLVIARDSGEATLWPALPVGEVIRRYEEEYGRPDGADEPQPAPAARVDLNQTSFLLSPPEWLQEAADKLGIPDRRRGDHDGAGSGAGAGAPLAETRAGVPSAPAAPDAGGSGAEWPAAASDDAVGSGSGPGTSGTPGVPAGATPWAGTDTNADAGEDRSVPLPQTVFSPPLSGADDETTPPPATPDAKTALMSGGSSLPPTALSPALDDPGGAPASDGRGTPPPAPGTPPPGPGTPPPVPPAAQPPGGPGAPAAPSRPLAPDAGDIADAATSKAAPPPRRGAGPTTPPPPGAPGVPGGRPGGTPPPSGNPAPGAPAGGYVPTQLVSSLGPEGPGAPGGPGGPGTPPPPGAAPQPPAAPGTPPATPAGPQAPGTPPPPSAPGAPGSTPPGGMHHAATMLADPGRTGGGAPQPPGPPGPPGAPAAPGAPGAPGAPSGPGMPPPPPAAPGPPGGAGGAVHHAQTVLAAPSLGGPGGIGAPPPPPGAPGVPGGGQPMPPGAVPPPGQPQAYGYPQPPAGLPTVGPGYQAVLRYRAHDGSEQQLIRRSAPGTPHPEWQMFHELRSMNVPPDQVLELHTELESCELPGAYCARMIREQWPQARITSIAPYGTDHASRQQGMRELLAHQGELHQVADGPARPAPVRAPLPQVQPVPPVPPEVIGQELGGAFGPGVFRFEQAAVSRQGVPPVVAHTLVAAGLPMDMGPFFWAQAQPGRPVPTLAELAAERGVQPASDAGSYLVVGSDFGRAVCVQYGTAAIVAVPVEAGPGGAPVPPQFVNSGLPEFARSLALLGRMWRLRFGLNQEQAGRWTVDFQAQLAALDPAALGSPESWWSVLLEQMWDGLL